MIVAFSVQPTGAPSDPALARDLGEGADAASVHDAVAAAEIGRASCRERV